MRTADLIGRAVIDSTGAKIGEVHDIRARRDGSEAAVAAYGVTHLLVAGSTFGMRLGYGYGHMHGPWPLRIAIRRLLRNGYAVSWNQVASTDPRQPLRLSVEANQLMTAQQLIEQDTAQ
jgi:PRC-barrel domain